MRWKATNPTGEGICQWELWQGLTVQSTWRNQLITQTIQQDTTELKTGRKPEKTPLSGRYTNNQQIYEEMLNFIRNTEIKTTRRCHLPTVRVAITNETGTSKRWRGCGGKGTPFTTGRKADWGSHHGTQSGGSSGDKEQLPCDLASPLLGLYLKNVKNI